MDFSTINVPVPPTFQTKLEDIVNETVQLSKILLEQPLPEALNFSSYAPKKVASDLHFKILPQIALLDKLTDDKINEIVRERLS